MHYVVKPGDALWKIAARELNDSGRWPEIAELNRLQSPYILHVGQSLRMPTRKHVHTPTEIFASEPVCRVPDPLENIGPASAAMNKILTKVDTDPELKGAGVVIKFPSGQTFQLRQSNHRSGLETVVVAEISMPEPADQRSWWERWNGVVLNCGGAAISWAAVGLSTAAEVPSLGSATPLVVLSYTSAVATTAQCTLAVAKETNSDFREYVETDGQWIDYADIALDAISLAGGVGGAINAVRSSSTLIATRKYAKYLNAQRKGKLLKTLQKIEKHDKDLVYFRNALQKLKATGKVADPAGRGISNNLLKRTLPYVTNSLRKETIAGIGDAVSGAAATTSSYYGGVGPKNLGLVKVSISILQENIGKAR